MAENQHADDDDFENWLERAKAPGGLNIQEPKDFIVCGQLHVTDAPKEADNGE